ncbi:Ig-like domain-containing protein [Spirochaeta isovalerica]|uniref:Ig-like domain-containing protein n=1 Tax=Spirochaeta isovalerica TaxID=150 RepID=A0A841R8K6_9SPIO|nr:Ig-like domain-containing protein [Spirochaeta isovalerica]MBB6479517.1 hypothetical protein [Spirochaeta isovalerica]
MKERKAIFRFILAALLILAGTFTSSCELFTPGLGDEIDLEKPVVGIESHGNGDYIGGITHIAGFVSDDAGISSVTLSINDKDFPATFANGEWSLDLTTTDYADGEYEISVNAIDTAEKESTVSMLLIIDNKPPTVIVTTPSLYIGKKFNDLIEIKGEASDKTRVKEVWINVYNSTGDLIQSEKATGTTSWFYTLNSNVLTDQDEHYIDVIAVDFNGNQNNWFYHISDIYALSNDIANVPNIEKIDGVDNQGELIPIGPSGIISASFDTIRLTESGPVHLTLDIDQSSNTPVITIDGITVLGPNSIYPDGSITGSVSDDDLVIAGTLEIAIDEDNDGGPDRDNWIPVSGPPAADGKSIDWSHSFAGYAQGTHSFRMRVSDSGGTLFEHTDQIPITVDNGPPSIQIDSPAAGAIFTSSFTIDGSASDGDIVSSVEISLDGGSTWTNANTTPALPSDSVSWDYDFTVQADGSTDADYDYQIRVTDGSGRFSLMDRSVKVDATIPTAQIELSPESSTVNGTNVLIRGTSNDNRTIDKLYLSINPESVAPPADITTWLDEDDGVTGKYSWTYTLDSTTLIDGNYDITVVSVDIAGNESTPFTKTITVDQESDRPVITFSDIDKNETVASNNVLTGANFLVGFISEDDLFDPSLFSGNAIEISIDGGGWVPVSIPPLSSGTYVKWQHDISTLAEGEHNVKVRARDSLFVGTVGDSSTSVEYISNYNWAIEDSVDQNGIPFILNSGPPIITINPFSSSYFVGTVTIEGNAVDANGVSDVDISFDNGLTWTEIPITPGTSVNWTYDFTGPDGTYDFKIRCIEDYGTIAQESGSFVVDSAAPSIDTISSPTGLEIYISGSAFNVAGTASDSGDAGIEKVFWWTGDPLDTPPSTVFPYTGWNPAFGTNNWSGALDLTEIGEGDKTIFLFALDWSKNVSSVSSADFTVDQSSPTLTEDVSGIAGTATVYRNADINLGGNISDGTGIASLVVSYSKNGGVLTNLTSNIAAGRWDASLPVSLGDGGYELQIVATDNVGRTTTLNRNIVIDTSSPDLTVESPVNTELVDSNSYTISGKISDNGGVGVTELQYSRDNTNWSDITIAGLSWFVAGVDFSSPIGAETSQGARTLYIRATDGLNPEVIETITFNYDTENPVLTEILVNTDTEQIINSPVVFEGRAYDSNALTSLELIINNGVPADITIDVDGPDDTLGNGDDNYWTYTHPDTTDGVFAIVFRATDAAGRTTTIHRNLLLDRTAPNVPVITSSPGSYVTSNLSVTGTASDGTSGINTVQYSIDGEATWNALSGTDNWFGSIDVAAEAAGDHTVYIRSLDRAGNISASASQSYTIDRDNPVLTVSGFAGNEYRNTTFTIDGTMSDRDLGLTPISLIATLDGAPIDLTGYPLNQSTVNGTWSRDIPVNPGDNGTCQITIIATDAVGRSVSEIINVGIDTTDPALAVTTDFTGWFGSNTVLVEGTASDGGSQLKVVQYSFDDVNWNNLSVTSPWSGYISIPNGTANPLYIRSVDNVGNESTHESFSVNVDTASPVTSMVSPLTVVKLNGSIDLNIQILAQDIGQSGVVSAKVKVNSTDFTTPDASRILTPATAEFNNTWTLTLPAAAIPGTEGQIDINVQFTDNAGNEKIQSFPVLVDRTAPSVPVISSHNDGAYVNKTITLSGSASDTQGLQSVLLEIYNNATAGWEVLTTSGTYSWNADIDTVSYDTADYDRDGGTAGTQIRLRVTATDTAGNTASSIRDLIIDQNTDRPVVSLNNLQTTGTDTLKLSQTVFGSLLDDDGIVSFEISEDNSNWTSVTLSGSSWQYDVSAVNGTKNLYFRIEDGDGTLFVTNAADEPRVIGKSGGEIADILIFRLDTVTPEINSSIVADRAAPFDFVADTATITTNMPFGGSSSHFALKVLARDANTISSVVIDIPGLGTVPTFKGADEAGYETYSTAEQDISALGDGSIDLVITVTDDSGLTSTATRTILIDNTAPDLTYLSPRSSLDVVNGDIPVRGLASDAGSALAKVEYKVGYNYAGESWQDVSGSLFNWEIDFSGINKIDYYAGLEVENVDTNGTITLTSHGLANDTAVWVGGTTLPTGLSGSSTYYVVNATADTLQIASSAGGGALTFASVGTEVRISRYSKDANEDSIWELPVVVRATDTAGNASVVSDSAYVVLVDPSGDKPHPVVVYPDPDNVNRVMGGIIRIFGTAEDDDGVDSVYIQIDVDGDNDYDAADIDTEGFDWYNSGEGIAVTGAASWNININTSGEFNPSGAGTNPINFRVRAKDIYGTFGPWSDSHHIDVDNSVPKIGSTEAPTLTQGATVQSYISDMYIKGNWVLEGTIEDESDISDIQITGDIVGSLAGNPGWFTDYIGSGTDGYRMQIPINTSGTGQYVFTVTAVDNSDPKTNNSATFRINYDNTAPTLEAYDGLLPVEQSNKTYHLTSAVNEAGSGLERVAFFFLRQGTTDAEDRLYNPQEAKAGDANRTYLNQVYGSGSTIAFVDGLPRLSLSSVTRSDEYTLQHNDIIGNTNVRKGGLVRIGGLDRLITSVNLGTGEITWSGAVSISVTDAAVAYALIVDHDIPETPVWNPDNTLASITNDDGDGLIEELSKTGTEYVWDAYIDSKEIPDGPIEIHWVAFDKSGNFTADFVSTQVLNHRPMLASVLLGTDLNGINGVEESEKVPAYSLLDGLGNNQAVATSASGSGDASPFTAKGDTTIEIEVIGGNGALQYEFFEGAGVTNIHGSLQTLRADEISAVQPITVSTADFTSAEIGEGDKNLVFRIWDSTEETTIGLDSQWAQLTVPMIVDVIDGVAPKAVISPFFWTSESDNSLYGNSKTYGHIELSGVIDGTDPDVSGIVSIRGTSYDDQKLTDIYGRIDSFVMTNGSTADYPTGPASADETYTLLSSYSGGAWSSIDKLATEGWKFSAADVSLDQSGHRIEWQLDWDSSKITNIAELNRAVKIVTVDKGNNPSGYTVVNDASDTINNIPNYTVDVVPYITGISTSLDAVYPANPSAFNRSALGYYPVRENEVITVRGFNLQNAGNAVSINGVSKTPVSGTASSLDINVGTDTASGAIAVVTNSISSQNNSNDNSQVSNKEDNNLNNSTLNDDRYLYIWSFGALVNSNSIADPIMRMDDSSNYYMSYGANANRFYLNKNGTAQQYDQTYNQFNNTMVAFDANGNIYGSTSNTDRIGDSVNGATSYTFYAKSPGSRATGNTAGYYNGTNKRRLELAYNSQTGVYNINRVEYPKMEIKGSGTDADPARVYMTYFDSNSVNNELKFRYGTVGTNADNISGGISNNLNSTNPGSATGYQIVADRNSTYPGGNYSDADALSDGTAVMTWYDAVNRQLIFSYNTNPAGATQAQWQTNAVVLDTNFAGWYVDMTVDDGDGIHIAYYSSGSGDLKYAYLSAYNASPTVVTVDSYLSTGTQITINTRLEGGNYVPYISYFQPSFVSTTSSVKVAWREDFASLTDGAVMDDYSGSWEVMTIPSGNVPVDGMVCNGVPTGGAYADQVFISYYTDAYYERTYLK